MKAHLRYLKKILFHKWFVFYAGLKTGAPLWRLIIHDWSKFTPAEWGPYVRRFGQGRGGAFNTASDPEDWHRAWTHHWHLNPHHWEYWLVIDKTTFRGFRPVDMPDRFIKEMVADWMGAGRAYTGKWDIWQWYERHHNQIYLTPDTRVKVDMLLSEIVL